MEQNKPQTEQDISQQAAVRPRSWPTCAPPAATPLSSPNIRRILTPLI